MKKLFFLAIIALLAIGTITAQGWGWVPPETVRVEGTLQLVNGQIVLSSGTATYYVPALVRYIGFIDELREGARVSVEGYASGGFLQVSKFTVGGREYDLFANAPGWGGPGWGQGGYACCHFGPMGGAYRQGRRGRW